MNAFNKVSNDIGIVPSIMAKQQLEEANSIIATQKVRIRGMSKQYDEMCQLKEQKIKYLEAKFDESGKKPCKVTSPMKGQSAKSSEINKKIKELQENSENFKETMDELRSNHEAELK